jgi:hypothetical protein
LIPSHFDCTTFVETVTALARSASAGDFYNRLLELRYHGGRSGFFDRNHFPEADWVPNNVKAGLLSDVTESVAQRSGVSAKVEAKRINRASWFALQLKRGAFPGLTATDPEASWREPASVNVSYLPVEDVEKYVDQLPTGAIVNIVRNSNPKQWVLITHQAVVVRIKGVAHLRHSTRDGRIHTIPLTSYLKAAEGASWPVVGINVLALPH